MFSRNDIKRIGRAVKCTEKVPALKGQGQPHRGLLATGDARIVHCVQDGGSDGSSYDEADPVYATWTYTITDVITGTQLATHVPVVCQRLLATETITAYIGTAVKVTNTSPIYVPPYGGGTGPAWVLVAVDERYGQENDCIVGTGIESSASGE
jgi:hypothetical protein